MRKQRVSGKKAASGPPGLKKRYVKNRSACKVCFRLPKEAAALASRVALVGEFNGWDTDATPLKRLSSGDFSVELELASGREYRFRYLIDGTDWENDWSADSYVPNSFGADDSVVVV